MKALNIFIGIFFLMALWGCAKRNAEPLMVSDPLRAAESVYMTNDLKGNPVVVWIETDTVSNQNFMFYAVSHNDGRSFSEKHSVPIPEVVNTHAEGMPKVAFMKDGKVIAAYERSAPTPENKYAGAIYYLFSDDNGKSWTDPRFMHSDTVSGRSRGFFDIATLPDGSVGASWLDVKTDLSEKGRSIRFAKTTPERIFVNEKVLERFACECCRTDLSVDQAGNIQVAYRSVRKGNLDQLIRDMAWVKSTDGGQTFSEPSLISDDHWVMDRCPHSGPALASTTEGVQAVWYTEGSGTGVFITTCRSGSFAKKEQISHSATHPQIAANNTSTIVVFEDQVNDKPVLLYQLRNQDGISTDRLANGVKGYFPVIINCDQDCFLVGCLGKTNRGTAVFVKKI